LEKEPRIFVFFGKNQSDFFIKLEREKEERESRKEREREQKRTRERETEEEEDNQRTDPLSLSRNDARRSCARYKVLNDEKSTLFSLFFSLCCKTKNLKP